MGLRADSARPQRVSCSVRTDSGRAESARNPIASHAKFGDDSAMNALTRIQWTAALTGSFVAGRQGLIAAPRQAVSAQPLDRMIEFVLETCRSKRNGLTDLRAPINFRYFPVVGRKNGEKN